MNIFTKNRIDIVPALTDTPIPWRLSGGKKAVALMSGGVDSAAAALMLLRGGYEVVGVTMSLYGAANDSLKSAAAVCEALSIPHFYLDISKEFKNLVVSPFCEAYLRGETPNPCAVCNERIKFGAAVEALTARWGEDFEVATGHYAKIIRQCKEVCLARADCRQKDQSYFLSGIRRELLQRLQFPLGCLRNKEETRKIARAAGLPAAEASESMEICFAAEADYRKVTGGGGRGAIFDSGGKIIGSHKGIANYTLGQRKGLGIASQEPLFVVEINACDNSLVVAPRKEAFKKAVTADHLNILTSRGINELGPLHGKIRSQGEPQRCKIILSGDSVIKVEFAAPVFAPAPGQRLVLYTETGIVAAGAVITP